jgi:hypothetical protein
MTVPATGFPDWQQYASWRSVLLFNDQVATAAGGTTSIGPFALTNYGSVRLSAAAVANGAEVQMFGCADRFKSQAELLGRWVIRSETSLRITMPNPQSFVYLDLVAEPALNATTEIKLQAVNTATDKPHYHGAVPFVGTAANVIAAGATELWYPNTILPGPAHMWLNVGAAAVNVVFRLFTRNTDGTDNNWIAQWQAPGGDLHSDFMLPAQAWRLAVINGTGVNQTYYFAITNQGNLT